MAAIEELDVGYALAANVANVRYEDLPASIVDVTKLCILDTLGTIVAGSGAGAGIDKVVDLVKEMGGKEESSVFGYGVKVPAMMAAFANGAMAHCLDYDDVHEHAGMHPTITILPAALATAERAGGVTGKEFVTTMAVGEDLICRLAYAVTGRAGGIKTTWMTPVTLGVFSAAAVSARLLGLNKDQILDAIGIAFNQAGSTFELVFGLGSVLRGMYAAFPSITGVLSALMAQRGIEGIKTCLEGEAGVFNVYFGGNYHRPSLTTGLGEVFEGAGVSFKPWPACRWTHTYIGATLKIVREHDLCPADIEEVKVFVGDTAKTLCEPLETRQKPSTALEAKFSLPFTVAATIARRTVAITDFSPEGLKDPETLALAKRVVPEYDPQLKSAITSPPARVDIRTKDGRVYSESVVFPAGHPKNPVSREDLIEKFRGCARHAARPIPEADVEEVIRKVTQLEKVADIREIIDLVA